MLDLILNNSFLNVPLNSFLNGSNIFSFEFFLIPIHLSPNHSNLFLPIYTND